VHEHDRRTFTEQAVADSYPFKLDPPELHLGSLAANIRSRYRHGMPQKTETSSSDTISRLADSGEHAMRNLVALPLRMLAGALGAVEAVLRTAADAVSEIDPIERVVDLEKRLDSLEKQVTGRGKSAGTASAARQRTPRASDTGAPRAPDTGTEHRGV